VLKLQRVLWGTVSFAAGIALGLKIKHKSNLVYVLIGDGETTKHNLETAMVAARRRLDNLVAYWMTTSRPADVCR